MGLMLAACGSDLPESGNVNVTVNKPAVKTKFTTDDADLAASKFADMLTDRFGHEPLARHEIFFITRTERYRPDQVCFDIWFDTGKIKATAELENNCSIHLEKLEYIYETFGYDVDTNMFKSEWFWRYAADYDYGVVKGLEGIAGLTRVRCPIAIQQFYNDKRVQPLPDARPLDYCPS